MGSAPSSQAKGSAKKPPKAMGPRQSIVTTGERRMTLQPEIKPIPAKFGALWDKADEANNVAVKMTKQNGFSQTKINLPILKPVSISWSEEEAAEGIGLRQIAFDGDKFVAVRNGWTSGPLRPSATVNFKFGAELEVKLASLGIRSTPLSVNVTKREDFIVTVTDDGFKPANVYITEGTSVSFKWTGCQISHSVWPIAYCPEHAGLTSLDPSAGKKYKIATKEGSTSQLFMISGSYFFSTEARDFGTTHTCIVNVRPYDREHIIRLFDTHYDPALLEIEQGDRVWWQWDTKTCKRVHCPFEVELGQDEANDQPQLAEDDDENREDDDTSKQQKFKPKSGGFRWYGPSKCGLLCHVFSDPGIYYFSDLNFDQMASYIGTIVVRPKAKNLHFVEITNSGFKSDNLRLQQGDQLWFLWDSQVVKKELITLMEFERCLTPMAIPGSGPTSEALFWRSSGAVEEEYSCKMKCHRPTSTALKVFSSAAAFAVDLPLTGVYHFKLPIPNSKALSVICNRSMQIRAIRVMKNTFKPKMLMISRGDVVCWSWRETGQHVIYQISNTGERLTPAKGGFHSGPKRGLDSAFLYQFDRPGVYYYSSEGVPDDAVGTIVVLDIPDVIEIPPPTQELMLGGLPIVVRQNDVVCWSFITGVADDLTLRFYGNGSWQPMADPSLKGISNDTVSQIKRRCLNRSMVAVGVFNYASHAFRKALVGDPNEPGMVTLVVDPATPCPAVVYVGAKQGFVPSKLTLKIGDSLIFDWRHEDSPLSSSATEAHNVFLVSNLNSATPMAAVHSENHFMHSGQPVADSTFLTTFTSSGTYTFASQGAPGMACIVEIAENPVVLHPPQFSTTDLETDLLDQGKTIVLRSLDPDSELYFSLDGSLPHPASPRTMKYSHIRGIFLSEPGPIIVRAIAISPSAVWSEVATSRLWIVMTNSQFGRGRLPEPISEPEEEEDDQEEKRQLEKDSQRWRALSLNMRGFPSSQPGCGEVLWTIGGTRNPEDSDIIESFQLFINNVTYSGSLPAATRGLSVFGLVGGKPYTMHVEAHPVGGRFLPVKSNSIVLNLPMLLATSGGPLMGVEFCMTSDKAGNTHPLLAVSWPNVEASRPDLPIEAYQIFVDGKNIASISVEEPPPTALTHHRFVLREGTLPKKGDVKVVVVAKLNNRRIYSNERKFRLPIQLEAIKPIPPKNNWIDLLSIVIESAALIVNHSEIEESQQRTPAIRRPSRTRQSFTPPELVGGDDDDDRLDNDRDRAEIYDQVEPQLPLRSVKFQEEYNETPKPSNAKYANKPSRREITNSTSISIPIENDDEGTSYEAHAADEIDVDETHDEEAAVTSYTTVTVPDERRASVASKGSKKQVQIKEDLYDEQGESFTRSKPTRDRPHTATASIKGRRVSDGSVMGASRPKSATSERERVLSSLPSQQYYGPDSDQLGTTEPFYPSPFPATPSLPKYSSAGPSTRNVIQPAAASASPSRSRKSTAHQHPQASASETTSATTTSTTSSFSSPRDYPSVDVDPIPIDKTDDDRSPRDGARRGSSPSSVATTVTHRSTVQTERRHSLAASGGNVRESATHSHSRELHSIHEAEVIDMSAPQRSSYQPAQIVGPAKGTPRRGSLKYNKLPTEVDNYMPPIPANNLLEALVDNIDYDVDEEHDERATPFVDDISGQEQGAPPAIPTSDLPIPIVQVIDESTSRLGETYPGGQVLVRWHLDPHKLLLMDERGLDISAFYLSVTGRVFADRISSHLSFDVAPDSHLEGNNAAVEGLLRHQWVLPGPSRNDDETRITAFSQQIDGLIPGEEYSVDVICEFIPSPMYTGPNIRHREVTSQSGSVHFRCQGPPPAPKIGVREVGIGSVTFNWTLEQADFASGYRLILNGKPSKKHLGRAVNESTLDGLQPGSVTRVAVVAVNDFGSSKPSREVRIVCADKPLSPEIEEQPNYSSAKSRGILIGWTSGVSLPGSASPRVNLSVSSYRVYVDGKLDGIVRKSEFATRHGYQYLITNVIPTRKYEINVRAVAGEEPVDSTSDAGPITISCPVISDASNLLVCSPPTAPQSPRLRVENMTILGIDLSWDQPSQQNLVPITGYQVLKNSRVYGSALPAESNSVRIREISLGETVELQLISLTDHPIGGSMSGSGRRSDSGIAVEQVNVERPIGSKIIVQFTRLIMPPARVWLDKISGRTAIVAWTHSSVSKKSPPTHFAVATSYQITWWSIGSAGSAAALATTPTGSATAVSVGDVCSQSLKAAVDASEQSFMIDNLKTDTAYTIVVEGRLESSYVEVVEDEIPGLEERHSRTLVLSASADPIRFVTGRPPDPPQNLAVLSTTCHSILIGWDPCVEHGVEVIGVRVECVPIEREIISPHHIVLDLLPNATEALLEGLQESCDYRISVIAITQEFFDTLPDTSRWKSGKTDALPKNLTELSAESPWLPRSVLECSTSGTFPADEIRIAERSEDWCKIEWGKPPRVVGTNRLVRIIVRWVRCERDGTVSGRGDDSQDIIDDEDDDFAVENRRRGAGQSQGPRMALWSSNIEVELGEKQAVLQHLTPGSQYQVVIEAVVSVKVNVSSNRSDQVDYSNRRTVHVPSRPIRFWTRCFIDPMPRLLCSSLSTTSVTISWERPQLTRIVGMSKASASLSDSGDHRAVGGGGDNGRVVRMHLLGYTLIVNQAECQQLSSEVLSCTLTNCKPATSYSIEIVAQTCIDPVYKLRVGAGISTAKGARRNQQQSESNNSLIPRDDLDENRFRSIHIKLPSLVPGCILSASLHIQTSPTYDRVSANASVSKIVVLWDANTSPTNLVKQFSVTYQCERTRQHVSKIFDSATRQFLINNVEPGTVYTVAIDSSGSSYPASVMGSKQQRYNNNPVTVCLQIASPGPPEMPRLIVTKRTASVLSLAWTDPILFSGDQRHVIGFKIVLDDCDYTDLLPVSCHAFSLPIAVLSPARRVCVVALLTAPDNASRTWNLQSNAVGLLGTLAWSNTGEGGYVEESMAEDIGRRPLPLPLEDADEQADAVGGASGDRIDIRVLRMDDSQIVIGWNLNTASLNHEGDEELYPVGGMVFQLTFTCSGQPTEKFVTIPAHHNSHTISPIIPGAIYKFHVMALSGGTTGKASKRMAVASSRELTVETPAPPDAPKLRLRAVNFEYVTVEWAKPKSYGNAHITSYKVYVNSVLEITLPANQLTFTHSRGRGCSEYTFQVQSVAGSNYLSALSEPLTLTWPGVRPPELTRYQASDEATMIRVGWEAPFATNGVTIRELFVHVVDRATRKLIHKVGPIHPDCREAEFINPFLSGISSSVISQSGGSVNGFNVFLEVCVAGVGGGQSFWSAPLPLVHSDLPPAPAVSARLLGLDDRMRVEQRAARLINRRDAISTKLVECQGGAQQSVTPHIGEKHKRHRKQKHGKTPRDYEQHLLGKLSDLDRKLMKVLTALEQYSGEAVVSLTVHIPHILTPDLQSPGGGVTGFRIFVDGKQLKTVSTSATTNPGLSPRNSDAQQQLHEVRLRLPLRRGINGSVTERPHRISVACVSRAGTIGPLSSAVEVSTHPFRPFVHFCNFLAKPSGCHPPPTTAAPSSLAPGDENYNHCRFVDIFRRDVAVRRYFSNRVLSPIEVGLALDASVFDLSTRRTLFLRTLARGNRALIVCLFVEAAVCAASSRALTMFADFATALDGLQNQITLIVAHHHHQSGTAPPIPEISPLAVPTRPARPVHHRSRRHQKRAVQPLSDLGDLDIISKPSVGYSLLTSIECDVASTFPESGRKASDAGSKKLCDLVRVSGVPTILILNGETECGWIGRFCALTSTEFGTFINHQINVISGVSCSSAPGCGDFDNGPGCIHCNRTDTKKGKTRDGEDSSLVGTSRNEMDLASLRPES